MLIFPKSLDSYHLQRNFDAETNILCENSYILAKKTEENIELLKVTILEFPPKFNQETRILLQNPLKK
jgi:hypothetical protein